MMTSAIFWFQVRIFIHKIKISEKMSSTFFHFLDSDLFLGSAQIWRK